jgi:hypothetical protein
MTNIKKVTGKEFACNCALLVHSSTEGHLMTGQGVFFFDLWSVTTINYQKQHNWDTRRYKQAPKRRTETGLL